MTWTEKGRQTCRPYQLDEKKQAVLNVVKMLFLVFCGAKNHVKQDEWRYTTTNSASRKKVKRARSKAKRVQIKKSLKKEL